MNLKESASRHVQTLKLRGEAALDNVGGTRKGQALGMIQAGAISLVVLGLTLTVGIKITSEVGGQINSTTASQGANDATQSLLEISQFAPVLGLVLAASATIALVSGSFGGPRRADA